MTSRGTKRKDTGSEPGPSSSKKQRSHSGPVAVQKASSMSDSKGAAPAGKKKMIIKPFKVTPKPPPDFEATTFKKLEAAVEAILQTRAVDQSHEELYRAVESLCLHKKSQELYTRLYSQLNQHVQNVAAQLNGVEADAGAFLPHLDAAWQSHCEQLVIIRSIFLFLDRTFVINTRVKSLWEAGLQLFGQHFKGHPKLEPQLVSGMLQLIHKERQGESINRPLLKRLTRMLLALKFYRRTFERPFLEATAGYYGEEGKRLMVDLALPDYLHHTAKRIQEESSRVVEVLDEATLTPLTRIVENELIRVHVDGLLRKGLDGLMADTRARRADLALLYQLLEKVDSLRALRTALADYVQRIGRDIVSNPAKEAEMVRLLLEFKDSIDDAMLNAFASNGDFHYALKDAFELFMNEGDGNKPAERIAKHVDAKLRTGSKGSTEEELDASLNKLIDLFRFLHAKDVFQAFYKKDLARRLLLGNYASIDNERAMLAKLKTECGASFTSKLENMFKDMEVSKEINKEFAQHVSMPGCPEETRAAAQQVDFSTQVLTTSSWPTFQSCDIKLPGPVSVLYSEFHRFYTEKHKSQKLVWDNSKATCLLRANFPKGRKELALSAYQAVVLMLFNTTKTLSYKQLQEGTGLNERELTATLQSLVAGKIDSRLLNKKPAATPVGPEDQFQVNREFRSALFRVKVASPQMKDTAEEVKSTKQRVLIDRAYAVDATIVRIMKARKTMQHGQLMSEVMAQLKVPSTPAEIKQRIAGLIERDYMERDEENANVYKYVA